MEAQDRLQQFLEGLLGVEAYDLIGRVGLRDEQFQYELIVGSLAAEAPERSQATAQNTRPSLAAS